MSEYLAFYGCTRVEITKEVLNRFDSIAISDINEIIDTVNVKGAIRA